MGAGRRSGGWGRGWGLLDKPHVTCGCKTTEPQTTEQTQRTAACSCGNLVKKTVPLDVITFKCSKHNRCMYDWCSCVRAQELCESRGGRPGLPVLNKPPGFYGRKATLNQSVPVP